jgi:superfamily II DNA or RNA helicase
VDERLIRADPRVVKQVMARSFLEAPVIDAQLGAIELAPHQVDAASRLMAMLDERGGAILADATGLGKTYVAIAVARLLGPAVVVAPAALRSMWRESLRRTAVAAGMESYEALSRRSAAAVAQHGVLILDEAHHARNPASRRYARLADLAWGRRVLLLSATPIHNLGRDIRALLALFLGSRAYALTDEEVRTFTVRRTSGATPSTRLPALGTPEWLPVPTNADTLSAITAIPPAVPAADGGAAHALLVLRLHRAWSSSESAQRAVLKRRLQRAAVLGDALE